MFLRNPHFCLSNQLILKQCCAPSMVQFANVQKIFLGKKSLNVSNVKLLSKFFFNSLWVILKSFSFQALIKGN